MTLEIDTNYFDWNHRNWKVYWLYLVCSHQEAAWKGQGLSRACSRHGGEGQPLACGSHWPSSIPLRTPSRSPCSGWSSPCSDTPWASLCSLWTDRSSPLKGRGSLLKDQSSPLKERGNLWRGPGSPWADPGSLWCSLCAPQIQALCPACSLEKFNTNGGHLQLLVIIVHHISYHHGPCLIELD